MEHGPWTKVTTRVDGKAWVERCDSCGITQTRIGLAYPVLSQPQCKMSLAGAERSTT